MRLLLLLGLFISPLVSALTLDDLQKQFSEQPVVRAHFDQTRTIKDLPQPLRSQGQMLLARDKGLLWDQTSPFPMQLLLDDKRMVQAINGQPPQTITAENNPQMFQFNHLCVRCSRRIEKYWKRTSAWNLPIKAKAIGRCA